MEMKRFPEFCMGVQILVSEMIESITDFQNKGRLTTRLLAASELLKESKLIFLFNRI